MIDATEGFTEQDSKVAGFAHEQGKACIIAVNKWDAVDKDDKTMEETRKKLAGDFSFMSYAPFLFLSAKTGQRVDRLFELIRYVDTQNALRVTTGMLFFAFSTIVGWYFFGETNVRYLFGKKAVRAYSLLVLVFIVIGSLAKVQLAWDLSDLFNGMRYERYILFAVLALLWLGVLDRPLGFLNNAVFTGLDWLTTPVDLLAGR